MLNKRKSFMYAIGIPASAAGENLLPQPLRMRKPAFDSTCPASQRLNVSGVVYNPVALS